MIINNISTWLTLASMLTRVILVSSTAGSGENRGVWYRQRRFLEGRSSSACWSLLLSTTPRSRTNGCVQYNECVVMKNTTDWDHYWGSQGSSSLLQKTYTIPYMQCTTSIECWLTQDFPKMLCVYLFWVQLEDTARLQKQGGRGRPILSNNIGLKAYVQPSLMGA